ncbi:MAG TPA: CerR family C-terminal domain-containing protein [Verrucomicrobiae bacterium]|nr:CerR family C-terminal domain-containing protein [Verrucomicrobiae bacterium]
MLETSHSTPETRQRLIESAAEVFADQGFHYTTVRDICKKAGTNVASINYHFGDKEKLYRAVFDYARRCAPPELWIQDSIVDPEERLRAYIQGLVTCVFAEGRPAWLGKLIAREMVEPTGALDQFVEEQIRPNHLRLKSLVKELTGADTDDEAARLACFSITAQCTYYYHCRSVVSRLYPERPIDSQAISEIVEHIIRFSLAGLNGMKP